MKTAALKKVSYDPSIFLDVETVEDAMRIIVTPEAGMTTAHRWDKETAHLLELIEQHCPHKAQHVFDYGCGIGRLAKPLIDKHGCGVIGVDISANMRALANSLCGDHLMTLSPDLVSLLRPGTCGLAISIWTLQHVLSLKDAVADIGYMLRDGGKLFVVNNVTRVLPAAGLWLDDGIDVRAVLRDHFTELEHGQLPDAIAPGSFKDATFWAVYQK